MAVYKRNYKRYEGDLTDHRWRFTILPRYAFQTVFESKMMTSFFTFCFLPHLIAIVIIYLRYNLGALVALDLETLRFINVDGEFFRRLFNIETYLSFLLITFICPNLVAPDLANNALPLYLSRPFTKREYILGKLSVLVTVTSLITWIPGLLLVGITANQEGFKWLWDNMRLPLGIVVGSWVWILTVSLIALALSSWIKVRPGTIFALFGVFFVTSTLSFFINNMLELQPAWGVFLDMNKTMQTMWDWLLVGSTSYGTVFEKGRIVDAGLPSWAALISLASFSSVALFLLMKKIRACEVVR